MGEGEMSFPDNHPSLEFAVKTQLFLDGDITISIYNPSNIINEEKFNFLIKHYEKISKKIKSLTALRRDVERIGSFSLVGLIDLLLNYFDQISNIQILGSLAMSFLIPRILRLTSMGLRKISTFLMEHVVSRIIARISSRSQS
ncbi:MAG: hypothetical protein JXR03_03040 [Cyclobacteriaceae bacterium]